MREVDHSYTSSKMMIFVNFIGVGREAHPALLLSVFDDIENRPTGSIMMSEFYADPVEKITSLKPFLKRDDKKRTITFVGDTMELRIPKRFEVYGMLDTTDVVQTLGIMDVIIDGKYQCSLDILSKITIVPTSYDDMVINGTPYLVVYLEHGDVFIQNTQVAKDANVVYAVYVEFITRGKPLYTLGYDQLALIFDRVKQLTGGGIGVDRVLFELIVSHLARDASDLFKQYRYTLMEEPPVIIPLRSVSLAPTTTSSRVFGSYFDDGLTSSLITKNTEESPFENIIRGVPQDV